MSNKLSGSGPHNTVRGSSVPSQVTMPKMAAAGKLGGYPSVKIGANNPVKALGGSMTHGRNGGACCPNC
jgi:hypothetical protein